MMRRGKKTVKKKNSGWIKRYLQFRLTTPLPDLPSYQDAVGVSLDRETLDECLYGVVHQNGIFFGCPILEENMKADCQQLGIKGPIGEKLFLYLETLCSVAIQESKLLRPHGPSYEERLRDIVIRAIEFFLPTSYFRFPQTASFEVLLKHDIFLRALDKLEDSITEKVQPHTSLFEKKDTLQNSFVFPALYFFYRWYSETLRENYVPTKTLEQTLKEEHDLRVQLILVFAALIWSDNYIAKVEQKILAQYIQQANFTNEVTQPLEQRVMSPLGLNDIHFEITNLIAKKYLIERLILLSMIDDQQAPEEEQMIREVAKRLNMGKDDVEWMFYSVGAFFGAEGHRFDFMKNNAAFSQLQEYVHDKVMIQVKLNMDRIVQEVKETKELSSLLMKAASEPLTEEEKEKVRAQLMDIAKTIPALAIFCLPAGAVLLAILAKVLPFSILPSAFQEEHTVPT